MKSKKDVGLIEDAIFYLENALGAENHARMSYINTKDEKWLRAYDVIRKIRKNVLDLITKKEESQIYCFTKHCLACSMGLTEVANRYMEKGNLKVAKELQEDAANYQALVLLFNGHVQEGKNV